MKSLWIGHIVSGLVLFGWAAASDAHAQCLDWKPGFGLPGGGVSGEIRAQAVYDDGSGPALFVGGSITQAGPIAVKSIAKWNGSTWSAVGGGVTGSFASVETMLVFDDGSGPALYVGGAFTQAGGVPNTSFVARWNGTTWSSVGGGVFGYIYAMTAFDDGSGPALYVAGSMSQAGGTLAVHNIAKWNGSAWSDVGGGSNLVIRALTASDVGTGPRLFASGDFSHIGNVSAQYIAQWDGTSWSALAGGTVNSVPSALLAWDDGTGNALYVAGTLTMAGSTPVGLIARWNGSTWSALGSGLSPIVQYDSVRSLVVHDDGSGPGLYAGGAFTIAGGQTANHVARWDGSAWSTLGSGTEGFVYSLCAFDDGQGARLYTGGEFETAGNVACSNIASWGDATWRPMSSATKFGIAGTVYALAQFDDGSGNALYAGGVFAAAGNTLASSVARWNGVSWSALGTGLNGTARTFLVYDDGSGPALYAGGTFLAPSGTVVMQVARWNGTTWSMVGTSLGGWSSSVTALCVFDDGTGPALYAGGNFAPHILKLSGASWSSVGFGFVDPIDSLAVFDDGSGLKLYAGGIFSSAGGQTALHVARWDGSNWSPVGLGLGYFGSSEDVRALVVYDHGSSPVLIAAGSFIYADGQPASSVAKWNGTSWTPFGSLGDVNALALFDDGSGPALYAGSSDDSSGSVKRWNGTSWISVGGGTDGGVYTSVVPGVYALAAFDDGTSGGTDLYVGGFFDTAGGIPSASIAEWRGCAGPGTLYCFGDGSAVPCPCQNSGQAQHGCDNSAATGGAVLASAGHTSPDTVVLASIHELPNALSIFLQGNATIAPAPFGDGLRCAGGALKRLYAKNAAGGVVVAPVTGDPSISARSAALGDPIAPGSVRYYQTYYRDPSLSFCPSPTGNTWNVTNGLKIQW